MKQCSSVSIMMDVSASNCIIEARTNNVTAHRNCQSSKEILIEEPPQTVVNSRVTSGRSTKIKQQNSSKLHTSNLA